MSEHQHYEFQAIDRPLTAREMEQLRAYSTRATITPTSFVNEYNWGSFKGDEDAWMARYFDAFAYWANWGTRVIKLRVPVGVLGVIDVEPYCTDTSVRVRSTKGKLVLTVISDDEDSSDEFAEDSGLSLGAIRAGLMAGDRRVLYLAWLLAAQSRELDDDQPEPPVPPGLSRLDCALVGLVDFLRLEPDLLRVAARTSLRIAPCTSREARAWLRELSAKDKDDLLARFVLDDSHHATVAELRRRFELQRLKTPAIAGRPRTVGELLHAAGRAGD